MNPCRPVPAVLAVPEPAITETTRRLRRQAAANRLQTVDRQLLRLTKTSHMAPSMPLARSRMRMTMVVMAQDR